MKALVLCAGLGTRLRPMTFFLPKPLLPVLNRPLLSFIVDMLVQNEVTAFGFNLHHLPEVLKCHINSYVKKPFKFFYEKELLGTGGSIASFSDYPFPDPYFLVYNGDIFSSGLNFKGMEQFHTENQADVTFAVIDNGPANVVTLDSDSFVVDIAGKLKKGGASDTLYTFTGIAMYKTSFARKMPKGRFYSVIDYIVEKMAQNECRICGYDVSSIYWNDIGTPRAYLELHRKLLEERNIFVEGYFSGNIFSAEPVILPEGFRSDGFVSIGKDVVIPPDVYIKDSVILDGAVLSEKSETIGSVVSPYFCLNSL